MTVRLMIHEGESVSALNVLMRGVYEEEDFENSALDTLKRHSQIELCIRAIDGVCMCVRALTCMHTHVHLKEFSNMLGEHS